ncbi:MAG: cytochrome-c oxidase, cbb3-type subunit III, partial [Steroidobacter sp.]
SLLMVVLTIGNIVACLWLIWWTAKRRAGEGDTTGHEWDGIQELNNPMPRWWLGLFLITIVFGGVYFFFYPGLGTYTGSSNWSSNAQLAHEQQAAQKDFDTRFSRVATSDIVTLSKDTEAMAAAKNLFANNCAVCHGSDARGAKGFPNLTDEDWLWGGAPETIYETIANGRKGAMPAWGAMLGQQGVEEAAAYVLSLSGNPAPPDWVASGKQRFETICVACHGVDGKGNQTLGAPNLTDNVWLYGHSMETLRETIGNGRNNEMPAHLPLLGEIKVKMLAAYVYGLSHH